ncbi:MAG: TlyA family RNA methyltransferase [Eubacterium sp.]|nr:TlyA family RNA methyltransferase [Eubacterium sp.]
MKERLDVILVRQGYAPSREKAKAILMAGNVFVDGQREDKAGTTFDEDKIHIEVKGSTLKYVSRGGLKLEKALEEFPIVLTHAVCMDIGASTGGFTDCMLQNGAGRVYSIDVGHGQLDWKLRNDERVVCMEKTNFRYVTADDIREPIDFASVDVSFISLTKILLPARNLLKSNGSMVCLIKPQFEAGKDKVGKKGVVREPDVHEEVVHKVIDYADLIGFEMKGLTYSPIKGPEGNIEYLVYLVKRVEIPEETRMMTEAEAEGILRSLTEDRSGRSYDDDMEKLILGVVSDAHGALDKEK